MASVAAGQDCSTRQGEGWVVLSSPAFSLRLGIRDQLRAEWLDNHLTGTRLALEGTELEADIGLPDGPVDTLRFTVKQVSPGGDGAAGECVFRLESDRPGVTATVTYRWNASAPVLHKFVEISNAGPAELNRLLHVRLGSYRTASTLTGGAAQGFPVYADGEVFLALAHPAGWATQPRRNNSCP